jgi:hypothetical protein
MSALATALLGDGYRDALTTEAVSGEHSIVRGGVTNQWNYGVK